MSNPFKETPGTIAAKILMLRAANNNTILLVEGEHDVYVMENFIDQQKCKIIPGRGKENVLGARELIRQKKLQGILYLVDRDFDFIRQTEIKDIEVIYTDTHDMDLMILSSPALDKVLREMSSKEKFDKFKAAGKDIRLYLLEAAQPIGCLRLHSLTSSLGLKFDQMGLTYIDNSKVTFDVKDMVVEVLNKSMKSNDVAPALIDSIDLEIKKRHSLWEICVGEDVLQLLTISLTKMIGSQKRSKIDWRLVQEKLRLAYERDFFRTTALYTQIKNWEKGASGHICLGI